MSGHVVDAPASSAELCGAASDPAVVVFNFNRFMDWLQLEMETSFRMGFYLERITRVWIYFLWCRGLVVSTEDVYFSAVYAQIRVGMF